MAATLRWASARRRRALVVDEVPVERARGISVDWHRAGGEPQLWQEGARRGQDDQREQGANACEGAAGEKRIGDAACSRGAAAGRGGNGDQHCDTEGAADL